MKGADWAIKDIVGGEFVIQNGGSVEPIEFVVNQSTSKIVEKIKKSYKWFLEKIKSKDLSQEKLGMELLGSLLQYL